MSIYFLSEAYSEGKDAGNKARNDVEVILNRKYQKLLCYDPTKNGVAKAIKVIRTIQQTKKTDIIIIQYPLPRGYNWMVKLLCSMRRCVLIIHDLYKLRMGKDFEKETGAIAGAYRLISHNKKMTAYLVSHGLDPKKIVDLGVFDYLTSSEKGVSHYHDEAFMCFAGNLKKSEFIYHISDQVAALGFNVFGINYEQDRATNLHYLGSFDSEEIHRNLVGKFGLIWDGDSPDTCNGMFGEYMRFNNPHKVSMCIAANMPILIWRQAALADFVVKNHIGYAIDRLDDIYKIHQELTEEEYQTMSENISKIREYVINGKMLERAIARAFGEHHEK